MNGSPLDGIRLVALDLDGTLLPSDKRVSRLAKEVARDLADAGIALTLATGRGWTFTERYARELGLDQPLVAFEGALVAWPTDAAAGADARVDAAVDDDARGGARGGADAPPRAPGDGDPQTHPARAPGRVLHHRMLAEARIREVLRAVADLGLGSFVCTELGRTVASRHLADRIAQVSIWDPHVDVVDVHHEPGGRGYILHLVGEPVAVQEAARRVVALGLGDVETFHGDFWDGWEQLQVRPRGIGKDVGLLHVLDHLGLGPEHVLAAGDWHNDLGMLRLARVAVAPANAVPEVRAIADHVLEGTCNDDAVVRFLADALRTRS